MTARERVLMIRLVEKLEEHPMYAKALGSGAAGAVNNQSMESDPKGLCCSGKPFVLVREEF